MRASAWVCFFFRPTKNPHKSRRTVSIASARVQFVFKWKVLEKGKSGAGPNGVALADTLPVPLAAVSDCASKQARVAKTTGKPGQAVEFGGTETFPGERERNTSADVRLERLQTNGGYPCANHGRRIAVSHDEFAGGSARDLSFSARQYRSQATKRREGAKISRESWIGQTKTPAVRLNGIDLVSGATHSIGRWATR